MKYVEKNTDSKALIWLIASIVTAFLFFSCGRKGPPIAPGIPDLSPVTGISYKIEENRVKISWDKPGKENESILTGYVVHRSRTGIGEENCDGCPVLFQRIAELGKGSTSYDEPLEKGNNYIYKIVAVSEYGSISPDSKFVKFEF